MGVHAAHRQFIHEALGWLGMLHQMVILSQNKYI
jgi:hypothetical protein